MFEMWLLFFPKEDMSSVFGEKCLNQYKPRLSYALLTEHQRLDCVKTKCGGNNSN
jgi:hypothetical protein